MVGPSCLHESPGILSINLLLALPFSPSLFGTLCTGIKVSLSHCSDLAYFSGLAKFYRQLHETD